MDGGRRSPAGRGELGRLEDDLLFGVLRRLDRRADKLAAALVCKRWLAVIRGAYMRCTMLHVGALKAILACCPLIQDLNCSKCIRVRDEHVVAIAERFGPNLLRLNLASNKRIGLAALQAIGAHCSQLQALWLTNGTFDDAALMPIASCHRLKVLGLANCRVVTDMGLCCVAAGCKEMEEVSLKWCVGVSDRGVDMLLTNCHAIHTLDLSYTKVTEAAMRVVQRHPSLARLTLASCQFLDDPAIAALRHGCTALQSLDVSGCEQVTDVGLMALTASAIPLSSLTAAFCSQVSDNLLALLPRFAALRCLKLDLAPITDAGLTDLVGASSPHTAHGAAAVADGAHTSVAAAAAASADPNSAAVDRRVEGAGRRAAEGASLTADGPGGAAVRAAPHGLPGAAQAAVPQVRWAAAGCWQLEEVSLRRCEAVGDEGLTALAAASPALQSLDITCCSAVTDATLLALSAHCSRLSCVRMEACRGVSDKGLVALFSHCTGLTTLDLTDCGISDSTLQGLQHCPSLQSLKLGFDMDVTDAGLRSVAASCSSLTELDLYRCEGVSCTGIAAVARSCPQLLTLNLSYCQRIRDAALIAIGRHCPCLRNLEVRDAPHVTSRGLMAIAGQLDVSQAPQLACGAEGSGQVEGGEGEGRVAGCRELLEVDVKQCSGVDDHGFIALAKGCIDLRQANLSYTRISDAGLAALAGMACMTKFNLVHCTHLSMRGLEAALNTCVGLKKVKLLQSWRPLISAHLVADLEESGCRFRWMDKPPLDALRSQP
ncbi:hypothetical protein CLOM_g16586 [Closterium sp. NIES-68]|nr:hypothetical protein CLOM_g16586 [Closterium sp. NIES-68]GJP69333.1 hypothetical protein CLOP_g271 [Closterium sp. NIES-67]GJP81863.1 hypothetical protein CLOP_g11983 [Closterium sp. NIES-67]